MKKIISYLGFARKSNNMITGQTPLKHCNKQLYLIMVCNTASDNLKNLAKNLANKHDCEFVILNTNLSSLINMEDIKIIGLTDLNLSEAIINELKNKENNIG